MPTPLVYFDITIDDKPSRRIITELIADTTQLTADDFRAFCTGELTAMSISDTNMLELCIYTQRPWPLRNGISVVVGQVVEGLEFVKAVERVVYSVSCFIDDCGEIKEEHELLKLDSRKKLTNCLVELAEVKKQLSRGNVLHVGSPMKNGDPAELEQEIEMLEKIADDMKQNLDYASNVMKEARLVVELHGKLITLIRKRISRVKDKKPVLEVISKMPYEDLLSLEDWIKKLKNKTGHM